MAKDLFFFFFKLSSFSQLGCAVLIALLSRAAGWRRSSGQGVLLAAQAVVVVLGQGVQDGQDKVDHHDQD